MGGIVGGRQLIEDVCVCVGRVSPLRPTLSPVFTDYSFLHAASADWVTRLGLVVRRSAGKRKDTGSIRRFGSPLSSKIVIYGHCLSEWLISLPILMRETILVVTV